MRMWIYITAIALVASSAKAGEFYLRLDKTGKLYGPFHSDAGSQVRLGKQVFTLVQKSTSAPARASQSTHLAPSPKLTRLVEAMIADGMPKDFLNYSCSGGNTEMGCLGSVNMGTADDPQTYNFNILEFESENALKKILRQVREGDPDSVVGHRGLFLLMIETKDKGEEILASFNKCVPKVKSDATRAGPPAGPSQAVIELLSELEASGVALGDVEYFCQAPTHKQGIVTHAFLSRKGETMVCGTVTEFKSRSLLEKFVAAQKPPPVTVMANQGNFNFAIVSTLVGSMDEANRIAGLLKKSASKLTADSR